MKIQYLGTAAAEALPAPFCNCRVCENARAKKKREIRTRSQAVIDDCLVVDYPGDTYDHMIRFGLDMRKVNNVLLTHSHSDHFYPEDITLKRPDVAKNLNDILHIYGNEANQKKYNAAVDKENRPKKLFTDYQQYHKIDAFETFQADKYMITSLKANHDTREECLLYLINDGQKTLFYGNDTGVFPQSTWDYLKGYKLDIVSLDCTMLKMPHVFNHMNLEDVIWTRKKMIDEKIADKDTVFVITHFSHNGDMTYDEIDKFARENGFLAAYDGFIVER